MFITRNTNTFIVGVILLKLVSDKQEVRHIPAFDGAIVVGCTEALGPVFKLDCAAAWVETLLTAEPFVAVCELGLI
jgi:hypothetical protein